MCGICGELVFEPGGVRREVIAAMRDRLVHRGPDDEGCFVDPERRIGLGFRRLAIIDLDHVANQPMPNEDGSIQVVFNGEIYNHAAIRTELESRGHRFRSRADTEVIAHLYEDAGEHFVERLDGMFAIAVWDGPRRRLLLARDRAGKKPLFYCQDGRRLVFGSEIKALFAHPEVPIRIDERQLTAFLVHGYVPHPATPYRGVRQVEPASIVTIEADGTTRARRYWQLVYAPADAKRRVTRPEAEAQVRTLTTTAVSRRLMSDVPLGAFLSAGIDSTIVVGLMSRLSAQPVKTFTIGFDGEDAFDETRVARLVAERFSTSHTEFRVRPSAVSLIDTLIWHHDGPFGDSSAIPTFLVSQLTRAHVTVVLTGDGGDEVFAGYDRFRAALAAERVPAAVRGPVSALLRRAPSAPHERHPFARARRFGQFMGLGLIDRLARWNSIFQEDVLDLVSADLVAAAPYDPLAPVSETLGRLRNPSALDRLLAANFASYLPDDLLVKTDRCTMANSLEARAPFLDTALMEYVATLPDAMKLAGRTTKAILRSAFSDLVPPEVASRPKTGFGVPLDSWFRSELRGYVRDLLLSPTARSRAYLRSAAIESLIAEHDARRANNGHRLWTLVCFERWLQLLPGWGPADSHAAACSVPADAVPFRDPS